MSGDKITRNISQRELNTKLAELLGTINSDFLLNNARLASTLSNNVSITNLFGSNVHADKTAALNLLKGAAEGSDAGIIFVMDSEGTVILSSGHRSGIDITGRNFSYRPYYKRAMEGRSAVYPAVSVIDGLRGLFFAHPVYSPRDSARPAGAVVVKQSLQHLDRKLNKLNFKSALISPDGVVFASNTVNMLYKTVYNISEDRRHQLRQSRQFADFPLEPSGIIIDKETMKIKGGAQCLSTGSLNLPGWSIIACSSYSYPFMYVSLACLITILTALWCFNWHSSIIKRRQAEAAELKARKQAQQFLDTAATILLAIDPQGKLILVNRYGCKFLGGIPKELIGLNWNEKFIPDGSSSNNCFSIESIQEKENGGFSSFDQEIITLKGEKKLISWHASIVKEEEEIVGVIASGIDISEKRRNAMELEKAKSNLEKSNKNLEAILNKTPFGVMTVGKDNRIKWVNNTTLEMTGVQDINEIIGKAHTDFLPMEPQSPCPLLNFVHNASTREQVLRKSDGSEIPILKTETAVSLHDENVIVKTFIDITEEKHLANELQQSHKMEAVGQLAAGIAHEINTPVQFVGDNIKFLQGCEKDFMLLYKDHLELLELADDGKLVEQSHINRFRDDLKKSDMEYIINEIPPAIEQSLDGVKRIAQIVRAMKEFSHPGVSGISTADINHAIETTVTVTRNEWKYAAEMELDLDPDMPSIPCLPGELNQVILNMIINARDAISEMVGENSGQKGLIKISTYHDDEFVTIKIKDSGAGIPVEVQQRIFDPFFTTKEVGRGSGQGLSISRNIIVVKHNGKISFESEPGKGTTFIIKLPRTRKNDGDEANNILQE
jgi:PAS domain S-box-containing protein